MLVVRCRRCGKTVRREGGHGYREVWDDKLCNECQHDIANSPEEKLLLAILGSKHLVDEEPTQLS